MHNVCVFIMHQWNVHILTILTTQPTHQPSQLHVSQCAFFSRNIDNLLCVYCEQRDNCLAVAINIDTHINWMRLVNWTELNWVERKIRFQMNATCKHFNEHHNFICLLGESKRTELDTARVRIVADHQSRKKFSWKKFLVKLEISFCFWNTKCKWLVLKIPIFG